MPQDSAVIIVGAGMAGLAAACALARSGVLVSILEARDRIGGRVFTLHDPASECPIELGAEFIHGRPPEIWKTLRKSKIEILEMEGDSWCTDHGKLRPCDFFSQVDDLLEKMTPKSPDESFLAFLKRLPAAKNDSERETRRRATSYVSGFNAADPSLVGVQWLVKGMKAEERIEGDRVFRARNGYEDLLNIFREQIGADEITLHTGCVVETVTWKPGKIKITARERGHRRTFHTARAILTLPLSLMKAPPGKAGVVKFDPALPPEKIQALGKLEMGHVIRVVLRFRRRFWETISPSPRKNLSRMSFLFTQDKWFPTWWTSLPQKNPILTAWAPFRSAEKLSGQSHAFVVERALRSLAKSLAIPAKNIRAELENAYVHDWQSDPFSRGAYSYGKVGANRAQQILARPLENTLFFAGEATDTIGHNGTVHGAIASGHRAARQILQNSR